MNERKEKMKREIERKGEKVKREKELICTMKRERERECETRVESMRVRLCVNVYVREAGRYGESYGDTMVNIAPGKLFPKNEKVTDESPHILGLQEQE